MGSLVVSVLVAIAVHASGECPSAVEVERQLAPLLGAGTDARTSDVAAIARAADGTLAVSLADAGGRSIGERRFPRAATCRDEAETVAVALAVWEAQLHPEVMLRLDRLSPGPEAASAPADVVVVRRVSDVATRPRAAVSLGAAAAGDWQPGSWAPAGRIELGLGRAGGRWRARVAAVGVGRHAQDVAPGRASWWRAAISLGADVDVVRGRRFAAVLGAGAVGGVAAISGTGFAVDRSSRSLDAGAELRARGEWRRGRVTPWVGVSVIAWLRRQELELEGAGARATLPRVEPMLAVGADFVW